MVRLSSRRSYSKNHDDVSKNNSSSNTMPMGLSTMPPNTTTCIVSEIVAKNRMSHTEIVNYVFDTIGLSDDGRSFMIHTQGITKIRQVLAIDKHQLLEYCNNNNKASKPLLFGDYVTLRNFRNWFTDYKRKNYNRAPSNWKIALTKDGFDEYEEIYCHQVSLDQHQTAASTASTASASSSGSSSSFCGGGGVGGVMSPAKSTNSNCNTTPRKEMELEGVRSCDIEFVCIQTKCDRIKAVQALRKTGGDPLRAIMSLSNASEVV